uniref:Family with sequence similarity 107 member A n=1 Tax=Eptatretus burgeri TaxID=7764 RepID=A0A8C4WYV8_EPTBU
MYFLISTLSNVCKDTKTPPPPPKKIKNYEHLPRFARSAWSVGTARHDVFSVMAEELKECDNSLLASCGHSDLIWPQKLPNPVQNSREHQTLHRELISNYKTGNLPIKKPELQKVLEKRKWEQETRRRVEEKEQKCSPLELELQKRQMKLQQMELEMLQAEQEQQDAPEFVKKKGTLRSVLTPAQEPSV